MNRKTADEKKTTEILVIAGALTGVSMMILVTATDIAVRTAVEMALMHDAEIH